MTEEVIKEVITSIPVSAEQKSEDHLINSPVIIDGDSVPLPHDLKRKEKPVPHYLRSSTKSCHENCKFGVKHSSSEPKKYRPFCRKQLRRASTGNQELGRAEIILPQRARSRKKDEELKISHVKDGNGTSYSKPEFTNPKAPLEKLPDHPESFTFIEDLSAEASKPVVAETLSTEAECCIISDHFVADCEDGDSPDRAESIELEMPLAIQDSDVSDEHIEDVILPCQDTCEGGEQSHVVPDQSANERAGSQYRKPQALMASKKHKQAELETKISPKESIISKAKVRSSMTINTVSSQKSDRTSHPKATIAAVESSSGSKTVRKTADAAAAKFSNPERKLRPTVTSAVTKIKETDKVSSPSNATNASAKFARFAKLKASTGKNGPFQSISSGKQPDRKMIVENVAKNAQVLQKKREEKVIHGPLKLPRSVNMSGKSLQSVKLRSVWREKIAPPFKSSKEVAGTENCAADANKDAKERIFKTVSPKAQKTDVNIKESWTRKEKNDTQTPRTRTARGSRSAPMPPSTHPSPRKLSFRRGKVLSPDDGGSSTTTPRRLRFRPATAATDAAGRSRGGSRKAGRTGGNGAGAREPGASRAEVVVLRRRRREDGEEGQRQEQVLLNNVIEETASRLVAEARKSKVKALVGAFETVISLQESGKAAAPATSAAAMSVSLSAAAL